MGLRFRKSIKIGKGFRINLSKSGIGYSVGGKGMRYTKSASGRSHTTFSIPGTGLSYTTSSRKKHSKKTSSKKSSYSRTNTQYNANTSPAISDTQLLHTVENAPTQHITSEPLRDFVKAISTYCTINTVLKIILIVSVIGVIYGVEAEKFGVFLISAMLAIPAAIAKIIYSIFGKVEAEYEFDEYYRQRYAHIVNAIESIRQNQVVWQVNTVYANQNIRNHAGASETIARTRIPITKKKPHFIKTNVDCYFVNLKAEKLYILPNIVIVTSKSGVAAINLSDLQIQTDTVKFVEAAPPHDTQVSGTTWKYVNKNGTPDKRHSDNQQLYICLYGDISFRTSSGFNTEIYVSNHRTVQQFCGEIEAIRQDL